MIDASIAMVSIFLFACVFNWGVPYAGQYNSSVPRHVVRLFLWRRPYAGVATDAVYAFIMVICITAVYAVDVFFQKYIRGMHIAILKTNLDGYWIVAGTACAVASLIIGWILHWIFVEIGRHSEWKLRSTWRQIVLGRVTPDFAPLTLPGLSRDLIGCPNFLICSGDNLYLKIDKFLFDAMSNGTFQGRIITANDEDKIGMSVGRFLDWACPGYASARFGYTLHHGSAETYGDVEHIVTSLRRELIIKSNMTIFIGSCSSAMGGNGFILACDEAYGEEVRDTVSIQHSFWGADGEYGAEAEIANNICFIEILKA